jgi:hypothetical protein
MSAPIWKRTDIGVTEYRLLWFLIDVGCMGHVAKHGWVNKCAEQMGLNRITITRTVGKLVSKGLLIRRKKGNVEFNMDGFVSSLPENFIQLNKVDDHEKHDPE